MDSVDKELKQTQIAADDLKEQISECGRQAQQARHQLATIQADLQRLDGVLEQIENAEAAVDAAKERLQTIETIQAAEDLGRVRANILAEQQALQTIATQIDEINVQIGSEQANVRLRQGAASVLQQTQPEWDELAERMRGLQALQKACSPTEIPSMIIDSILPELEENINEWLALMTAGEMVCRLETVKQAKRKSNTNPGGQKTLDIVVSTANGTDRAYDTFSGGERVKLDLACRIGINRLLASRANANIDFLVIDEGWGALDEQGIAALIEALTLLSNEFGLILTITHVPAVAEAFPSRFEVTRNGGLSTGVWHHTHLVV
jgi:exonuclease SbcC